MSSSSSSRKSGDPNLLILSTAQALFDEGGLPAVTMEGVSARAGIAKTTLYRRWKNREQLALDMCLHAMKAAASIPVEGSFAARMRSHLRAAVRFLQGKHGDRLRQLIGAAQSDALLRDGLVDRFLKERRDEARAFLNQGKATGEIHFSDVEATLDLMAGPLYHRLLMGHLSLTDRFADEHCDLILRALSAPARP